MHWKANGWLAGIRCVFSPNQGERPVDEKVSLVVLHNISLPPDEFGGDWVEQFFVNRLDRTAHPYFEEIADLQVSAHFFIKRSGRVIQFVSTDKRAWHAGQSSWNGRANCNDYSIGIELEGCDSQPFTEAQYDALWPLLDALRSRYPIESIAGHCHVAPGRKTDPGPCFDWAALHRYYPALSLPAEITF